MTFNIDADIRNADWSKQVWDLFTPDGSLVSTLEQLRQALPGRSDAELKHLLDLPVAQDMPAGLKAALESL